MWITALLTLLIFIECITVIYMPSYLEGKLTKVKKSKFVNMENFENIASGAILALAFIHMLPEAIILSNKKNINLYNVFTLVLGSIAFLNITDILYEHNMETTFDTNNTQLFENKNNSIKNINEIKYVNDNSNEGVDLEMKPIEDKSKNDPYKNDFFFGFIKSNSFFIILSLFVHSTIEGLLMGSLKDKNAIVIVGLSMLAHKWAECLIIYKNVMKKIESKALATIYAWSFIISFPLGVFIAMFSFPSNEIVEIIFSSIACGFFLYLSFNMTKDIKITKTNKNYISFSYFLGICGISGLMLLFNSFENNTMT